jgi:tetratricopeptide (TPR) repeat protein
MIWLGRRLFRDFPRWERSAQSALIIGIVLLLFAIGIVLFGPTEIRVAALVGSAALLLVLQVTVLWANRGMVTPFTNAQRYYLAGDLEQARDILETVRKQGSGDVQVLTLLGNTYRQLGDLDKSHSILYEALDKAPNHYFPLYGFGRTLLSEGNYTEAVEVFQRAVKADAPTSVRVDLAEAYYRAGQHTNALAELNNLEMRILALEPHRQLITTYLRFRLNGGSPPEVSLIKAGLHYWEATLQRFRNTRYGSDLAQDIQYMRGRIE